MDAYDLSDADDRLAALVERAEAGETVDIVRDGRVVARLTNVSTSIDRSIEPIDLDELKALRNSMPFDPTSSVAQIRRQARY